MKEDQKHTYDAVYVPTLDITLIVDHRTLGEPLQLVSYYYGEPDEKHTKYYIKMSKMD